MVDNVHGAPNLTRLLIDPAYLLQAVDPAADTAAFLPVEGARLRKAAFVDGREPLSDRPVLTARGLSAAVSAIEGPAPTARYVFHGAFCGSTLLARLLDAPGHALVLREPDVLSSLADRKLEAESAGPLLGRLCALATSSLFRPRRPGEPVVVKPSNWVNNLLDELCDAALDARAVFIESELSDFLEAVFRGGTERFRFVTQAAWRLSRAEEADRALIERAARDAASPGARAANLAVVLHVLQRRRFAAAQARAGWERVEVLSQARLTADPLAAADLAALALELELPQATLEAAVRAWAGRYSKDAAVSFTPQARAAADRSVRERFGAEIAAARAWARSAGLDAG